VLLSFAQFEREVTGERIRDKIAASKSAGHHIREWKVEKILRKKGHSGHHTDRLSEHEV
jgi:DNA invertase Pin-like site-specific DNA recombinase